MCVNETKVTANAFQMEEKVELGIVFPCSAFAFQVALNVALLPEKPLATVRFRGGLQHASSESSDN